ncbi:hypothetical protein CCB80_10280 [Armatimonadetes bacterium Uphvl-Ar1]|nr:hypothetical protein CCB80_10280 [Armatimonadetes bacterium Uphvl-Ar1]
MQSHLKQVVVHRVSQARMEVLVAQEQEEPGFPDLVVKGMRFMDTASEVPAAIFRTHLLLVMPVTLRQLIQ